MHDLDMHATEACQNLYRKLSTFWAYVRNLFESHSKLTTAFATAGNAKRVLDQNATNAVLPFIQLIELLLKNENVNTVDRFSSRYIKEAWKFLVCSMIIRVYILLPHGH